MPPPDPQSDEETATARPAAVLSDAGEGTRVRILSLPGHPALRERLLALGIRPGVVLEVLRRGHPGGILHLADGSFEFMLRREHAAEILVRAEAPRTHGPPISTAAPEPSD